MTPVASSVNLFSSGFTLVDSFMIYAIGYITALFPGIQIDTLICISILLSIVPCEDIIAQTDYTKQM